jgi:hypothetical protein
MVSFFLTTMVVILYIITLLLSNQKSCRFMPFWYVFILYFFKPFFSRIIAYYDSLGSFIIFDLFSTVCAMLFPLTLVYYYYFFYKTITFNFNKSNIYKYFIIFSLLFFIQTLNPGTNLGQGFLALKNLIFIIFSFFMVNLMLSMNYPYHKLLSGLIIFGIIYVAYGVFQAWFGLLPFDLAEYSLRFGSHYAINMAFFKDQVRPFSFALTTGHFYYSLVIILLFLLPQLRIMIYRQRMMFHIFILLCVLLFIKSPERTPIGMFGIGLITMYYIISNATRPFKVFIFSFTVIGVFMGLRMLVLPILKSAGVGLYLFRVFELFDILNAETFVTRAGEGGNWGTAITQIMQRPFFGYGTGTGTFTRMTSEYFYPTHNDFLTIAMELGLFGFFFFIFLIFKIYEKIRFVSKLNDCQKNIAGGIGAALAAQLACSMFNISLLSGESSRLVWFLVGILPVLINGRLNLSSGGLKKQTSALTIG